MDSKTKNMENFWNDLYNAKAQNTTSSVIAFYDKWAKGYEDVLADNVGTLLNAITAASLGEELDGSNALVLDIACGTGKTAEALAKVGFQNIDGIDGSQEMLKIGKERGIYQELMCGLIDVNGLHSVLKSNHYDGVVCVGGISLLAVNIKYFLQEITRILKPGGVAVYTVFEIGHQHGRYDDTQCTFFLEEHASMMRQGKLDILSMTKKPYFEMFGTQTSCYLFKTKKL